MKLSFGRSIANGQLRYASASSVQLAQNCLRAYAYDKIAGLRQKQSAGQARGAQYHAEAAVYHTDGDKAKLSPRLLALLSEFPTRFQAPNTFVDVPLVRAASPDAQPTLADAPHIGGVPFIGEIDLLRLPIGDEPLEIEDYKFVKDFKYILTPFKLAQTIQPTVYGLWARQPKVKLTYVYVRTTGPNEVKRVSTVLTADRLRQNADEIIIPTLNLMKSVARAGAVEPVPGNSNFCDNYGGCDHRSYCPFGTQAVIQQLFGENPVTFQMPANLQPDPNRAAIEAAKQQFAAAEAAAHAAHAQAHAQQTLAPPQAKGRVSHLLNQLLAHPQGGSPQMVEALAQEYAREQNFVLQSPWLAGAGQLGQYQLRTYEELETMARTLLAPQAAPAAPVTPPTFGALPMQQMPPMAMTAPVQVDPYPHLPAIVPPDAPPPSFNPNATMGAAPQMPAPVVAAPQMQMQQPAPVVAAPQMQMQQPAPVVAAPQMQQPAPVVAPTEAKAGRGRPPKAAKTKVATPDTSVALPQNAVPPQTTVPWSAPAQAAAAPAPVPAAPPAGGLQLFVNCMAEPVVAQNLRSYVDALVGSLLQHYNVTDLRNVAEKDHVLAYGGWRAIVSSVARANPPQGPFFVDVRGDELAEAVVQGLRPLAAMFVRGH